MSPNFLQEYLGPFLGFVCTTGTILFIALNAHKTGRPTPTASSAAPVEASNATEPAAPGTPATGTSL